MGNIIIGIGGRKESGKTELSKICKKHGFEIVSFANPLKSLIAKLFNISFDDVNLYKKKDCFFKVNESDYSFLSKETSIQIDIVRKYFDDKVFLNTREALQYIGTDFIRKHNSSWHVSQIKKYLLSDTTKNYVIDDLRFPNEKEMIESLGGTTWFVIRPSLNNISNHISETSLKWQDFDNVIVNDSPLEYLKLRWDIFLSDGYDKSLLVRKETYKSLSENKEKRDYLKRKYGSTLAVMDIMFISKYEFEYEPKFINNEHITKVEQCYDYTIVYYGNGSMETVINPFMIEDLKMYVK